MHGVRRNGMVIKINRKIILVNDHLHNYAIAFSHMLSGRHLALAWSSKNCENWGKEAHLTPASSDGS